MRVAFLGPEGTFSEEALLSAPGSEQMEPVPEPTIYDCVMAVQEGTEVEGGFLRDSVEQTVRPSVATYANWQAIGKGAHDR